MMLRLTNCLQNWPVNRYTEYKDSGIEWIGKIPKHWETKRLKFVCIHVSEKRFPTKDEIKISPENVESHTGKVLDLYSNYETQGQVFCEGDILFNKLRVYLNKVVLCKWSGLSMGEMIVLRSVAMQSAYLHQVLGSQSFIDNVDSLSEGVKMPRPPIEGILNSFLPVPQEKDQIEIFRYLDKKTFQIDYLTEKIERKIELLKEFRTTLINQCVTQGLDPDVEKKDSGIEWIREIPRHWPINRLANLCIFSKGKSISKSELVTEGFPCILYSEIYTKFERVFESVSSYIDRGKALGAVKINCGTFLFTCSGETKEDIGKCVLYQGDGEIAVGGDCVIAKMLMQQEFSLEFLSYVFNANYVNFCKESNARGDIIVHIYTRQIREIVVALPPKKEQSRIAHYLDKKTSEIDSLINNLQRKNELLQEYRHSLISNVVTGKIRVSENEK